MCLIKLEDFTQIEQDDITANDYVFCQGYYNNLQENLKEYWLIHKIACDRNGLKKQCVTHECLKYL